MKEGVYDKCAPKATLASGMEGVGPTDLLARETRQLYERPATQPDSLGASDVKLDDLAVLITHTTPDVDLQPIVELQSEYLVEHEGFLAAEFQAPSPGVIDEKSALRVNRLSTQFQEGLAERVDREAYRALTGLEPHETVDLIDPSILENAQRAGGQE